MGRNDDFNLGDELLNVLEVAFQTSTFGNLGNGGAILKFLEHVD
jgi:hypothetical protein